MTSQPSSEHRVFASATGLMRAVTGLSTAVLGLSLVWCATAEAVQIKRVQSGVVNFDQDDVVQSKVLTYPVNQAKSILLL